MTTFDKIILFARFSSKEQGKGTTLERQLGDMRAEVARDPEWAGVPILTITDEGKSAFHGHHRSNGEFGKFEHEVLSGEHPRTLFLCEKFDRLSREGHETTQEVVNNLIRNGVTIKTLDGDYLPAGQPLELVQVITLAVKADLARKESQYKADRTASNWSIRRMKAKRDGTLLTKNAASWIKADKQNRPIAIEDRAALILQWFQMADEQIGADATVKIMARDGIEPWTRYKGRKAQVWQRTFISRILSNREVIGEFHPKVDGKACPDGPWVGHFPAIVPADLFERVNAKAPDRKKAARACKSVKIVNLFSSLVVCKECGAKMRYTRGRSEGAKVNTKGGGVSSYVRDNGSLICPVADASKKAPKPKCRNGAYLAYLTFEDAVLDNCLHLALDDTAFSHRGEVARLSTTVAERAREEELAREKAKRLWHAYSENGSDMAMKLAMAAEAAANALKEQIALLITQREQARGRADSEEHIRRVADVRANLYHEDLEIRVVARRKVMVHMHSLIQRVEFDGEWASIFAAQGHLLFFLDRKGKLRGTYDFVKFGRTPTANISDYLRRREASLAEGGLLVAGRAKQTISR